MKVYRPEDQVFDKASLGSYAHKPVTNDHPDEAVTPDNWKAVSVGQIGDEVARDGEFVGIPPIVMDAAAIKAIDEGKRELSAGYTCDLAWEPGTTPEGENYDAIQKDIRINHVINASYEAAFLELTNPGSLSPVVTGTSTVTREKIGQYSTSTSTDIEDIVALATPVVTTIEGLPWPVLVPCWPGATVVQPQISCPDIDQNTPSELSNETMPTIRTTI